MKGSLRSLMTPLAGMGALELGAAASKHASQLAAEIVGRSTGGALFATTRSYATPAVQVQGVSGDAAGVLSSVDSLLQADAATSAKDLSDAAVALAYLGARGNRRLWGKVLEKAGALGPALDGASLANLSWALSAANVNHTRTVAELAGSLAANLACMTPSQVSYAIEALGKSGAADVELFATVADIAEKRAAELKAGDLARLLWGFGAAGVQDAKLVKVATAGLVAKAAELTGREAAQALWGLAALRRVPEASLASALNKALKGGVEASADAAAAAWATATLSLKLDGATLKALSEKAKAGAADLSPAQAVQGGWGLAMLGDKEGANTMLAAAGAAISKDPTSLSPSALALLHAGAVVSGGAGLPPKVAEYAAKGFGLAVEHARHTRGSSAAAFHAEIAEAAAYATGARHRPDLRAKVASFSSVAPDGSSLEVVVPAEGGVKLAVIGVEAEGLAVGSGAVLGGAVSEARVREAQGYKVALVPQSEWLAGAPIKQRAAAVLAAIKKSVPSLSGMADKAAKEL